MPRITDISPNPADRIISGAGLETIEIQLDQDVTIPDDAIEIFGVNVGTIDNFSAEFDALSDVLTITLGEPVFLDIITVVLDYSITNGDGIELDGELRQGNLVTLPSGNGVRGGKAVFRYEILQGDVNDSGQVDLADLNAVLANFGSASDEGDASGDGQVNLLDLNIVLSAFGLLQPNFDQPLLTPLQLAPEPGSTLSADLSTVTVTYSDSIDPQRFDASDLFVITQDGTLRQADGVDITMFGTLEFTFSPPLPRCGTYSLNLSNAIGGPNGSIALRPGTLPVVTGLAPPSVPTTDPVASPTTQQIVTISGSAPGASTVRVVGPELVYTGPVTGGQYSVQVELPTDMVHTIFVSGVSACGVVGPVNSIDIIRDTSPPFVFIDFPFNGQELTTSTITVAGRVSDEFSGLDGLSVSVNGQSASVGPGPGGQGSFVAMNVPLSLGSQPITVTATDQLGNKRTESITVTRVEVPVGAPTIEMLSGDGQSAPVRTQLSQPIEVLLTNSNGLPLAGKVVTFSVVRNNGTLAQEPGRTGGSVTLQVISNSQGIARAYWTLGNTAGPASNRVRVTSRDLVGTVFFCADGIAAKASRILVGDHNNQKGETGAPLAKPLIAYVTDGEAGNPIAEVSVIFTVTRGDGLFENGQIEIVVPTGTDGRARAPFTLGSIPGLNRVEATFFNNPGLPAVFSATGVARSPGQPTTLSGVVLDNGGRAIGGALATLTLPLDFPKGPQQVILGPVETGVDGRFTFDASLLPAGVLNTDLPGGPANVLVSGVFATSIGGEPISREWAFPYVAYEVTLVENAANTLQDPVWLPELDPANENVYDGTEDVVLTIAGIDGLEFRVKAGSMTLEDGTIPTPANPEIIRLNQVHFDEVPMALPDGNAVPFAWTLQPKNAQFDPPVEITLPNVTGEAPGTIVQLLQWNNDTADFQTIGTGTVSNDGAFVVSESGSGIRVAGWGGVTPPPPPTAELSGCESDPELGPLIQGLLIERDAALADAQQIVSNLDSEISLECRLDFLEGAVALLRLPGSVSQFAADFRRARLTFGVASALCPAASGFGPIGFAACNAISAAVVFGPLLPQIALIVDDALEVLPSIDCIRDLAPLSEQLATASSRASDAAIAQAIISSLCTTVNVNDFAQQQIDSVNAQIDDLQNLLSDLSIAATGALNLLNQIIATLDTLGDAVNDLSQALQDLLDGLPDLIVPGGGGVPEDKLACEILLPDGSFVTVLIPTEFDCEQIQSVVDKVDVDPKMLLIGEGELQLLESDSHVAVEQLNLLETDIAAAADQAAFLSGSAARLSDLLSFSGWNVRVAGIPADLTEFGTVVATNLEVSPNLVRIRAEKVDAAGEPLFFASDFFTIDDFVAIEPPEGLVQSTPFPSPVTLSVTASAGVLEPGQQVQFAVIGHMSDGTKADLAARSKGTTYRSTDPAVASITDDGLLTAHSNGLTFITVVNEGVSTVNRIDVASKFINTTIVGTILRPDGTPATGAEITSPVFGGLAVSGADGSFGLPLQVPSDAQAVSVRVSLDGFVGVTSEPAEVVPSALTDIGVISLQEPGDGGPLFLAAGYDAGTFPWSLTWEDLDSDGDSDIVVVNNGSDNVSVLLNNGDGTFAAQQTYSVGDRPLGLLLTDLDGDGDADMIVRNGDSDDVSVLLNSGDGTFNAQQIYAMGDRPLSVALADLDGDDNADVVVLIAGSNDVSVLLNNGDGTFASRQTYATGSVPVSVALADLDDDGDADMVVANVLSDDISVLLNSGDGTFATQQVYFAGNGPVSVALADLDGDGDTDMAVANNGSNDVSVLLNNGDATFAVQQNYGAGIRPQGLILFDLDGDGDTDIAIANGISDDVSVLLNDGDGTFAAQQTYSVGDRPFSVELADLDGDGDADMVVVNDTSDDVSVLLNNGDGTFADQQIYVTGVGPVSVALADLDGDGDTDMAAANATSGDMSVLINKGDGTFAFYRAYDTGDAPHSVALADLDGDGDADMVVANRDSDDVSVLLNTGSTFDAKQTYSAGNGPLSVAPADLDGDGDIDLVVANQFSADLSVLLNDGNGTFAAQQTYAAGNGPRGVSLADLDGDGDVDIVVAIFNSDDVSVLLNTGDGTFAAQQTYAAGNGPWGLVLTDLDGDGDADMAVANLISDDVSVLLNIGGGSFAPMQSYAAGDGARSLASADLDGDGDRDIAVANINSKNVSVLLNIGGGTFAPAQAYAVGGGPSSVALEDLDGDGDMDIAVTNSSDEDISVLLNNGDGTFASQQAYDGGGWPLSVAFADLDGDGDMDMAVANRDSDDVSVLPNLSSHARGAFVLFGGEPHDPIGGRGMIDRRLRANQPADQILSTVAAAPPASDPALDSNLFNPEHPSTSNDARPPTDDSSPKVISDPMGYTIDGHPRRIIAQAIEVMSLDAQAEEAIVKLFTGQTQPDPLVNASGQRAESRVDGKLGVPRAVLVQPDGGVVWLPAPAGAASTKPIAINARGMVIASADMAGDIRSGFMHCTERDMLLPIGPGASTTTPRTWLGGEVVLAVTEDQQGTPRLVLWSEQDGLLDLTVVAEQRVQDLGLVLTDLSAVLDDGVLIAEATDSQTGEPMLVRLVLHVFERLLGDVDASGIIDQADLTKAIDWIQSKDPRGDLNLDGVITADDLAPVVQQFGHRGRTIFGPTEEEAVQP